MSRTPLQQALSDGNPAEVNDLIRAGHDIHYQRANGFNALLDAVHGREIGRDTRLLSLLALLIEHQVHLSAVSSYAESGLRVLSRIGRFDGVKLLLNAGADRSQLGWTPLIEAVAIGSVADVANIAAGGANLEEIDWWERTAWLVAILTGDIEKARLLRDVGAKTDACGRCGKPPLFHAIEGHHAAMLRWLIGIGADVNQPDDQGGTALIKAVDADDLECVEILLQAGALIDSDHAGIALKHAHSRPMIMRLLQAGGDPADADQRVIIGLPGADERRVNLLDGVSAAEFRAAAAPAFGNANPELMQRAYWVAMIRSGVSAYTAREHFGGNQERPGWCAQRFGQSLTLLPDGRAVQIAGEHEDYYDPDFCIYNDVFLHEKDGSIQIFGYPDSVFPPTDFHTATLIGEFIYIIGSAGYTRHRKPGLTPVYRLDTRSFRIDCLHTTGDSPGWIYRHRAQTVSQTTIRIWGGTRVSVGPNGEQHDPNAETFELDLIQMRWRRIG